MFKIESKLPLPSKCLEKYKGLTFDGCWFYLSLHCACQVVQFDKSFNELTNFDTRRNYSNLCYDLKENCFWATSDNSLSVIYKLNDCFEEIDCIHICLPTVCCGVITGLSYNCCDDTLIISCVSGIICVNKKKPKDCKIIIKSEKKLILHMSFVCPYYFCYCFKEQQWSLQVFSRCGHLIKEYDVPCDFSIESLIFNPCKKDCSSCHFYLLVSKDCCYPYILDCILDCDEICKTICSCNYDICDKQCCLDKHCDHKQACCDILESIALVETSIAHVLNAEGEKLQKVIASTDDVCEIMQVNNSVNKTIVNFTHLEQLLYDKMEVLSQYCDYCKKPDCDCYTDCCKEE